MTQEDYPFRWHSADLVDELIVTGSRVTVDRDGFTTLIDAETIQILLQ